MAWIRWSVVLLVGTVGCTRSNPLFGSAGDDTSEDTGPMTGSADDLFDSGPIDGTSTGTTSMGGTSPATGMETSATGPELDTGPLPDAGAEETDGGSCVPTFEPRILLDMTGYTFEECVEQTLYFQVTSLRTPTIVAGQLCGSCPCRGKDTRDIEFPFPPNLAIGCYALHLQLVPEGTSCRIEAFSLAQGEVVLLVGSNVYTPSIYEPFGFTRDDDPAAHCGEGCMPMSGYYGLSNDAGEYIPPDSAAHEVMVDTGGAYDVYNFGSGINTECEEVARWYAELAQ